MERRLAAILAADIMGYSRLMAADETGTIDRQKTHRAALLDPKIAQYGGRIVKTTGDGMLVEFPSVVDAVQCAVEIQRAMLEREAAIPHSSRIRYRIGINLGDIVIDGDDILGDGVNVAARLENLSEPQGLCVSDVVYQNVQGKLNLTFHDLGERTLKNMERKVRAWSWTNAPNRADSEPPPSPGILALPNKPSIAVLPFTNMSGDPEQEYFSDGITEDIITELSRFRSLFVIARNSSFAFRNRIVDVADVGRQLGVRYVVEGSVRKAGDRVRVTVQLVDAANSNHIWAERYDRHLDDIFTVQDEVVRTVVATLVGRLEQAGREIAEQKPPSNLVAYDFFLRGRDHFYHMMAVDNRMARVMFEKAVELDPGYAPAYAGLAESHLLDWFCGWGADFEASRRRGLELAEKSVSLDDADSRAHAALGWAHLMYRHYDQARFHFDRALALNPNDTRAIIHWARYLMCTGRPEESINFLGEADRLNPFGKHGLYKGMGYYTVHDYGHAIQALASLRAPVALVCAWLAACYAQAGRTDDARRAVKQCDETRQTEAVETGASRAIAWTQFVPERNPYQNQKDTDHLVCGLRKAGLE